MLAVSNVRIGFWIETVVGMSCYTRAIAVGLSGKLALSCCLVVCMHMMCIMCRVVVHHDLAELGTAALFCSQRNMVILATAGQLSLPVIQML